MATLSVKSSFSWVTYNSLSYVEYWNGSSWQIIRSGGAAWSATTDDVTISSGLIAGLQVRARVEGSVSGDGDNHVFLYEVSVTDDGGTLLSPSVATVFNGSGLISNYANAYDRDLSTYADVFRSHFSALGDAPVLTVSSFGIIPTLVDSIQLSDVLDFVVTYPTYADALVIDDEIAVLVENIKKKVTDKRFFVNDNISLSDLLETVAPYITAVSDTNSLSDGFDNLYTRAYPFSDSISLSDDAFPFSSQSDSIALLDAAAYALEEVPPTAYTFHLSDILTLVADQTHFSSPEFLDVADTLILRDHTSVRSLTNMTDYLRRYLNDVPTPLT